MKTLKEKIAEILTKNQNSWMERDSEDIASQILKLVVESLPMETYNNSADRGNYNRGRNEYRQEVINLLK